MTVVKSLFHMFLAKEGFVDLQSLTYYKRSAFVSLPMARGQTEATQVRWLTCRIWLNGDSPSEGGPGHKHVLKLLR